MPKLKECIITLESIIENIANRFKNVNSGDMICFIAKYMMLKEMIKNNKDPYNKQIAEDVLNRNFYELVAGGKVDFHAEYDKDSNFKQIYDVLDV